MIGVGESGTKKPQCWFTQEYTNSNPPQDMLQRDIREWTNTSEKGQGHSQPKGKGKGKGKGKREPPGKGNHNQNQTGSPDEETEQRTLSDFGMKRLRVLLVGHVHDGFEAPREDQANYAFCVHRCENVMSEYLDVPSSSGISGVRVIEEPAGTHELKPDRIDQLLTLEVLCPRAQWIMRCQFPQRERERVNKNMNLESVLGETLQHCGVKRNVPFVNRKGGTMSVNLEVTDTKRATLPVHKGCGNGSTIVNTPDGRGKIINDKRRTEHAQQIMGLTTRLSM